MLWVELSQFAFRLRADISIVQGMALQDVFQWNGNVFAVANTLQGALGKIYVLEFFQVLLYVASRT